MSMLMTSGTSSLTPCAAVSLVYVVRYACRRAVPDTRLWRPRMLTCWTSSSCSSAATTLTAATTTRRTAPVRVRRRRHIATASPDAAVTAPRFSSSPVEPGIRAMTPVLQPPYHSPSCQLADIKSSRRQVESSHTCRQMQMTACATSLHIPPPTTSTDVFDAHDVVKTHQSLRLTLECASYLVGELACRRVDYEPL